MIVTFSITDLLFLIIINTSLILINNSSLSIKIGKKIKNSKLCIRSQTLMKSTFTRVNTNKVMIDTL